jgi:glucose-fructose oxidoreductase
MPFIAALLVPFSSTCYAVTPDTPIRVVIVGLEHEHVAGLLYALPQDHNVELVGIAEPDTALAKRYAMQFHLDKKLFFTDTEKMLTQQHPDAVLVYTDILDHRKVIELAASHGISSMVEKPLATTVEDAIAIRKTASEHHVHILVNYETTWYASNAEAYQDFKDGKLGDLRRVVFYDGNMGPKGMRVAPEFLAWLTDPIKNGAGAMFDFGCYGADLMTVLMNGQTPLSVTAVALTDMPQTYTRVDDDATIILRYQKTQALLQPSWNWTFARKDMELYGSKGYEVTVAVDHLRKRFLGDITETESVAKPLAGDYQNPLDYLVGVLRGQIPDHSEPSSLDTNMIVVQVLAAAHESVRTGRTVELKPLPQ